ncbi:MAG TPA: SDR family NAD(P)-dependent oxidoreductase [Candidatus Dormibacteraeota bacterium]|nr:SDR family NAD(P)-dependent oxidoreductase [Candidatus Dormibacteraeota bacterium]
MGLLDGKVAAVTGAGRGIGRAHALALAEAGAAVVVNDVGWELRGGEGGRALEPGAPRVEVAQSVVDEIAARGGRAVADGSNVASLDGAAQVVDTALRAFGDIHIVVNNAGTWNESTTEDIDEARIDEQMATHFKGTVGTTRAAVAAMRARGHGGRIVNTVAGLAGGGAGGMAAYSAAKSAIASYTQTAAAECAADGIGVNAISPLAITRQSRIYFFRTGQIDPTDSATIEHLGPHHNSPLVVYLASDLASHISGRFFIVFPTAMSRDAQIRIVEAYVTTTEGVVADGWTVESVAEAMPSILRPEPVAIAH